MERLRLELDEHLEVNGGITPLHYGVEPAQMRAADDTDEIFKNIERIRRESAPKCPKVHDRLLADCLRMDAKCGEDCPHKEYWTGPHG